MRRRLAVCLALCLVGGPTGARAVSTRTGSGIHCKSQTHRFSVTVPGQWHKVTQQQMDMLKASISPDDDEVSVEYMGAYGQDYIMGNPTSLIGVMVVYYKDHRRISHREIKETVKLLTGADLDKIKRATRGGHGRNYRAWPEVRNLRTRDVTYSDEKRRLVWDAEITYSEAVTIRMQLYGYFGNKVLVMVGGFAPVDHFDRCDRALVGADKSFRFDPGAEFQKTLWYESSAFAIVLIGVAAALLAFALRKRSG